MIKYHIFKLNRHHKYHTAKQTQAATKACDKSDGIIEMKRNKNRRLLQYGHRKRYFDETHTLERNRFPEPSGIYTSFKTNQNEYH